jgi:hypothetical protein
VGNQITPQERSGSGGKSVAAIEISKILGPILSAGSVIKIVN